MTTVEQRIDRVEDRVDHLDAVLGQFIAVTGSALTRLEREMREFKDEMKEFKDEMKEFKDEMKEFKDEMGEYKDWSKANIENMNTQWGNLSRRMGTLVEDIFFPSAEIVIERYFNYKVSSVMQRRRERKNGEEFEADILAFCEEQKTVFIFEIKSNPDNIANIDAFKRSVEKAPDFISEIKGHRLISVYGGLSMRDSTLKKLTSEGLYGVIFKGNVLEIPNFNDIK